MLFCLVVVCGLLFVYLVVGCELFCVTFACVCGCASFGSLVCLVVGCRLCLGFVCGLVGLRVWGLC